MAIYDGIRVQLQELLDLVTQVEQYTAAVAYGAIQADKESAQAQQHRAVRIFELKRDFGLD